MSEVLVRIDTDDVIEFAEYDADREFTRQQADEIIRQVKQYVDINGIADFWDTVSSIAHRVVNA